MPALPDDILARITRIEAQLRETTGRAQIRPPQNTAVGGDFTVGGTQALRVLKASGVGDQFLIGQDGGQRAAKFYRPDGTIAFSTVLQTTIWDGTGNAVLHDDSGGVGLGRPYLPMVAAPARTADWLATMSATFEDVWRLSPIKLNPRGTITIGHIADASTAGEVQVTVAGSPVGSPTTLGTTLGTTVIGPFTVPGALESTVDIRVQARRTSGLGTVRCVVLAANGFHS
ncbi:hypothetical protein [Kitasatospora purpeofusca]|uniref:hypothetical protein n=1 Tax=Kitasatospora purpeofusca TaxID=67352 RepID=UPI00366158F7